MVDPGQNQGHEADLVVARAPATGDADSDQGLTRPAGSHARLRDFDHHADGGFHQDVTRGPDQEHQEKMHGMRGDKTVESVQSQAPAHPDPPLRQNRNQR